MHQQNNRTINTFAQQHTRTRRETFRNRRKIYFFFCSFLSLIKLSEATIKKATHDSVEATNRMKLKTHFQTIRRARTETKLSRVLVWLSCDIGFDSLLAVAFRFTWTTAILCLLSSLISNCCFCYHTISWGFFKNVFRFENGRSWSDELSEDF